MDDFPAPNDFRFSRDRWERPARRASARGRVEAMPGNPRLTSRDARGATDRDVWGAQDAWDEPAGTRARGRGGEAVSQASGGASLVAALRCVPMVAALGIAALALAAAMALAGLADGGAGTAGSGTALGQTSAAGAGAQVASTAESPVSTPRSEWARGKVPYLYQTDPAWASEPYADDTIATSGCGPTSLAMVYVALTGRTDYDPAAMGRYSEDGGYVEGGLTAWRLMGEGCRALGLRSHEVAADATAVRGELAAGRPVICSVGPGDFTETGHFIVLSALTDDGRVVVHDPNSEARSHQSWDLTRVLGQCRNLWAFERA